MIVSAGPDFRLILRDDSNVLVKIEPLQGELRDAGYTVVLHCGIGTRKVCQFIHVGGCEPLFSRQWDSNQTPGATEWTSQYTSFTPEDAMRGPSWPRWIISVEAQVVAHLLAETTAEVLAIMIDARRDRIDVVTIREVVVAAYQLAAINLSEEDRKLGKEVLVRLLLKRLTSLVLEKIAPELATRR